MAVEEKTEGKRKHIKSELGSEHGASYFNGRMVDEEYLSELKFPKSAAVYDRMRRNDPTVGAVILSVFNPIQSATWSVVPASDDAKDVEIAKFVSSNFFPEEDKITESSKINKSWEETLHEILLYIPFGFSVMEKVYSFHDGKVWLKKLSPRLPRTIKEFIYRENSNDFKHAVQRIDYNDINLPASRVLIFTANKEGATLSGISYLRVVYKPWSIKTDLQRIQASTFERYGMGTPTVTLPPNVSSTDPEGEDAIEALENLSSNETSYLVLPDQTEVSMLAGGSKTMPEMQSAIDYCDQQITISFLAQFLNLGVSSFGSRALGNTFVDFFTNSLEGIGDYISSRINQDLVQELVDMNFTTDKYPKLIMSRIDSVDMDNIAVLSDAGLISSTYETEVQLRKRFRLAPITEEEYEKARAVPNTDEGNNPDDPDGNTSGEKKRGKSAEGKGPNKSKLNKKDAKKQLSEAIRKRVRHILKRRRDKIES